MIRQICAIAVICSALITASETAADGRKDRGSERGSANPVVAPINSVPYGMTYGHWAALWHQWAWGTPLARNPVLDTTGEFCAERQIGNVWFLAGSFATDPVVRHCSIPANKALFFPLVNVAWLGFLDDPAEQRTEAFVRSVAKCEGTADLSVSIDGAMLRQPQRFFTGPGGSQSPLFNVQMGPDPVVGIFGLSEVEVRELLLSPSGEQGYYLFVNPLSRGAHTIRFTATACGFAQDITYHLTVGG